MYVLSRVHNNTVDNFWYYRLIRTCVVSKDKEENVVFRVILVITLICTPANCTCRHGVNMWQCAYHVCFLREYSICQALRSHPLYWQLDTSDVVLSKVALSIGALS